MTECDSNIMSYEKCYTCPHEVTYYTFCGGMCISCRITGNTIDVKDCVKP